MKTVGYIPKTKTDKPADGKNGGTKPNGNKPQGDKTDKPADGGK